MFSSPTKAAQALPARRHVDSPKELVFIDLLERAPPDENEVEGPIQNQPLDRCCSIAGAFFFRQIESQPDCIRHDVHAQSLEHLPMAGAPIELVIMMGISKPFSTI